MSNQKIWLSSPHMGGSEKKFVDEAFETNWIAPLGPNVDNFELDLAKYTGAKYAAALCSGTAAIHLALIMLNVKAGDEVICSSFTFSASCNPIVYQGAIPIFVDSEQRTWNMDPELLEMAIKDRIDKGNKPKAIILVHLYGMPAEMESIVTISNKYEIPIIEDAAEALGSTYHRKALGTFGRVGILSFNGNKIITTSGGGALISDDERLIKKSRFLATQARDSAPHYQHSEIGYNYRMSNICAGIGRGQMEVIDQRVSQRRNNFEFYKENLQGISSITFVNEPSGYFSNRWLTTILLENFEQRETIRLALEKVNIESRPLWKPMHIQPIFQNYPQYINGTSENLFERGLCLPSGSNLTENDLKRVIETIESVVI
ncbi:MAG: aminotransferase class I/II-fold pyridoxal phosphate-dependent enzyme [Bacteroidota bacterium]